MAKSKTLNQRFGEYFLYGYLGLASVVMPSLVIGRKIYHEITADVKAVADMGIAGKSLRSLYGFDRNKDGQIDEIKEHTALAGPMKVVVPIVYTYTPKDKEFEDLAKAFDIEK